MSDSIFPIDSDMDWSYERLQGVYNKLEEIVARKYKLDFYTNQIDVVTSEQMLDAYAGHGMPVMYKHWSFGKSFIQQYNEYAAGNMGLAYEMVINSNPCVNYLMEENTMGMQTLVLAHAAFGHNCFFKTNYLFKQWTDADGIIDYLMYANEFIAACEEKYGPREVEQVLDAAHVWQYYGVDKYKRPSPLNAEKQRLMNVELDEHRRRLYNFEMDRSVDQLRTEASKMRANVHAYNRKMAAEKFEPEENILYFIEKHAPTLPQWKKEIVRIIRRLAQYFYPQIQTKVMNEGFATFMHYHLMHDLREEGLVTQGAMLEFYKSHTGVVAQYGQSTNFNPYALGFAMFMDIKRICLEPTDEDREWFSGQKWVGEGDWIGTIKWAVENFKDESFIRQFLSPKVIRDFKMFVVQDDRSKDYYRVTEVHDTDGYKQVRTKLADRYVWTTMFPEIQVTYFDAEHDRSLYLTQTAHNGLFFNVEEMIKCATYLASLWEFPVIIEAGEAGKQIEISVEVSPNYDDEEGGFDVHTHLLDAMEST